LGVKRAQLVRSADGHVKRTSWNDRKTTTVKWQSRESKRLVWLWPRRRRKARQNAGGGASSLRFTVRDFSVIDGGRT
jgi:hypothetical protein